MVFFYMKLPRFFFIKHSQSFSIRWFYKNYKQKNNPLREIKGLFFVIYSARKATAASFFAAIRAGIWPPIMVKIVLITIKIIP